MVKSPNIKIMLNTDYKEIVNDITYKKLIYTGPIDEYFDNCFGVLLYRSIEFKFETYDMESFQPAPSTRYPQDYDFTRITEFKKMTGQKSDKTTICKEFPCFGGEKFYPYPSQKWKDLAEQYRNKAKEEKNTIFIGRLAEYKYYDMDDIVRKALDEFQNLKNEMENK